IIVVVNGLRSDRERTDESRHLIDAAFRDFKNYPLLAADAQVGEAKVFGGAAPTVALKVKQPVGVTMPVDSRKDLKVTVRYNGPIMAPVAADQEIGKLTVTVPGKPDTVVPVYAAQGVGRAGFMAQIGLGLEALLGMKGNS